MSEYGWMAFGSFVGMLVLLLKFHENKLPVGILGILAQAALFLWHEQGQIDNSESALQIAVLCAMFLVLVLVLILKSKIEHLRQPKSDDPDDLRRLRWLEGVVAFVQVVHILLVLGLIKMLNPYLPGGDHAGEERFHLLWNLGLILPAFSVVAHFFEHSGSSYWLVRRLRSDFWTLVVIGCLSFVLDNIATAMIGGTIMATRYGKHNVPFSLIVAIITASNIGGAPSPVGDTTTTMIFIYMSNHGLNWVFLLKGLAAAIPALALTAWWGSSHGQRPISEQQLEKLEEAEVREAEAEIGVQPKPHEKISWSHFLPLLGIPGLLVGNIVFHQPAIGLLVGLGIGMLLGMINIPVRKVAESMENTAFLLTLIAAAEMLPLSEIRPILNQVSKEWVSVIVGLLSTWFDNIPLTSLCLNIGDFDWAFLAYCVGVGGSAMWFGSSAGVAIKQEIPNAHDTKQWIKPFFVVTGIYLIGAACYQAVWNWIPALFA